MLGILVIIIMIAIALVIAYIFSLSNKDRERVEKKISSLTEQKYALAHILFFLCDNIPDENEVTYKKSFNDLRRDITDIAKDIMVRYSNDEELEETLSRIRNRTGVVYTFR